MTLILTPTLINFACFGNLHFTVDRQYYWWLVCPRIGISSCWIYVVDVSGGGVPSNFKKNENKKVVFQVWIIARMDPLKYLFEKPTLSGRLSRWLILSTEFDFKYMARKTIKGSTMLDFCAENPIKGESGREDFPDKDILDIELGAWKMYFNGVVK